MRHKNISTIGEYLLPAYLLFLAPGLDYLGSQHQPWGVLHTLVHLSKTPPSGRKSNNTHMRPTFQIFIQIFKISWGKSFLRLHEVVWENLQPVPDCMQMSEINILVCKNIIRAITATFLSHYSRNMRSLLACLELIYIECEGLALVYYIIVSLWDSLS